MKVILRKIIPKRLYTALANKKIEYKFKSKLGKELRAVRKKYEYCVVFIAIPTHGNLGDQAIVYSQYKVFESLGLRNNIVEIKSEDYKKFSTIIERLIDKKDIIVIDGGGNMGTLWIDEEYKMRDIIKRFNNNKIIIFPETVFYSDDDFGRNELIISKEVYENHNNLHICVRDKKSFNLLKQEYKSLHVEYTPDIVLFLSGIKFNNIRENALFCIRTDKEKSIDNNDIEIIKNKLKKKGLMISYSSTLIDDRVNKKEREEVLYNKWSEFASAKIIVTDRLHGMIFAAITGTPCIALNNCNGKVEGVYEWIKQLCYIVFCDTVEEIEETMDKLLKISEITYDNEFLMESFKPLLDMIKG